jgi:hypothetical protein
VRPRTGAVLAWLGGWVHRPTRAGGLGRRLPSCRSVAHRLPNARHAGSALAQRPPLPAPACSPPARTAAPTASG